MRSVDSLPLSCPATWMRGGTSKGLFFHDDDLPRHPEERERFLLSVIGSPDPYGKQIDGVGGATSSTSKIAIIAPADNHAFDIEYTFGHVPIAGSVIDYSGNCGNLTAAVGVFAIQEGLVSPTHPITTVRVWQTNVEQSITLEIAVDTQGNPLISGSYTMAGVPAPGSPINISFNDPSGFESTLPTGSAQSTLPLPHPVLTKTQLSASLVNAGNPTVFIRAEDVGLYGNELPAALDNYPTLLPLLEHIRIQGAIAMGLIGSAAEGERRPATPKVCLLSAPSHYTASNGQSLSDCQYDISARIISMGKPHHAITGTGAIALAVASQIPGSLAHEICGGENTSVRIGHPAGVMEAIAQVKDNQALSAGFIRTARTLMKGAVYRGAIR